MRIPPVAIVGRGCVLPGALSPEQLWTRLIAGDDLTSSAPPGRWRLDTAHALTHDPDQADDRTWSDRGGYVHGFDEAFDPTGLAVPADELQSRDPLVQWLVHAGRQALAGIDVAPERAGAALGVLSFPTAGMARFAERVWTGASDPGLPARLGLSDADPRDRFMAGLSVQTAAAALGLGAFSFALDAACASSLYAIALGCRRLADGDVDVVLAGAVNRSDDLFLHVGFCALQALSRSGRSRPFHAGADGLLPAEGCALVALERLDDAVRLGHPILGVIHGLGLSNDGAAGGILAPDAGGQARAIQAALTDGGVDPASVSYVECHATGTAVGDGVELASLAAAYGATPQGLGSIKANMGHPITAAGAASLLKVLGAMEHATLPPTPHEGDVLAVLADGPRRLVREPEPWPGQLAGVSAFGFGGNNAHLLVGTGRPGPEPVAPPPAERIAVVGLGARVGQGESLDDLRRLVQTGEGTGRATAIDVALEGLRMPPNDLAQTLPQQIWLLEAAREAAEGLTLPAATTGVMVGMGTDPEIARWGARWRLAGWRAALGGEGSLAEARDGVVDRLRAAGVVGTMPNIPANRVQAVLDLGGAGFTVSSEELSGVDALDAACRALVAHDLDAAVVGAVDMSCEPVHEAARAVLGRTGPTADAAVAVVLQRASDAEAAGHRVLAWVELGEGEGTVSLREAGEAHAAVGLLDVAAAVLTVAESEHRQARVATHALGGREAVVLVTGEGPVRPIDAPPRSDGPSQRVAAHWPAVVLPTLGALPMTVLPLPPELPPIVTRREPRLTVVAPPRSATTPIPSPAPAPAAASVFAPTAALGAAARASTSGSSRILTALAAEQQRVAQTHAGFMTRQGAVHDRFLASRRRALDALTSRRGASALAAVPARATRPPVPTVAAPSAPELPGLKLDRQGLEVHAGGPISTIFGEAFAQQDGFERQVRMPEPPMLLADRVVGLDAEPGVLSKGTVWTETDVRPDAWYLNQGRMPAGILIESGQANLLLISYMGIDWLNRSDRVYRLLGCTLTYEDTLPVVGDTLRYEIHVDGHAKHDDVRLMFFHYSCADQHGRPRLTVHGGQAGFFTDEELLASDGILWDAATAEHDPDARVDAPVVRCTRDRFSRAQLDALAAGDAWSCFGPGWERAAAHTETPRIQGAPMLFLDEVERFDAAGGPWGRGYLRGTAPVAPDDWFFEGHFKNDPCMPGTLMFEGCVQALSVFMAALGLTVERDGWRFEPVPGEPIDMRCRGQVRPGSRHLTYEVFVEEVHTGPTPMVFADLLCTVDGLKAFHARRCGLRLVPGWPADLSDVRADPEPVAAHEGFAFGHRSMLACASGRPSEMFGPMYAPFDDGRKVPRLPGEPYHFVHRAVRVQGPMGGREVGSAVEVAWDVPTSAWYLDAVGRVPFCVLLEAALQPCGWLASYVGSAVGASGELFFRNLDGTGSLHREVRPGGTLRTEVTLTSLSQSAGMIIESFDVRCHQDDELVWQMQTTFGFFPAEALAAQKGLPGTLPAPPELGEPLGLPPAPLGRLARVGVSGKTAWAETDVDPSAWPFRAHFFQDPVQPGSLGMEAMLQLLQHWMRHEGLEPAPIAMGHDAPITWTYRGQVLPTNQRVQVTLEVTSVDDAVVVADASLWVDGMRTYGAAGLTWAIAR